MPAIQTGTVVIAPVLTKKHPLKTTYVGHADQCDIIMDIGILTGTPSSGLPD